ncbi:MAG: amidase [Castellaniella sp.]
MSSPNTIAALHQALTRRETSSEALVKAALERIAAPEGEGRYAFTRVHAESALQAARVSDQLLAAGQARSPLEGLPISIKDLFDLAGDVTTAGSVVLADQPAATASAPAVQRLLDAGAVIVGRTNMTEFAFSGLGINPHYGTPASPWDRGRRRIPGGSSSGAAVAVADDMSVMSLGTDTGGSVRIPSAFCGTTGFKPTARRVPIDGGVPLATSLDSVGPLARSVQCCITTDAILANETGRVLEAPGPGQLRLAVPDSLILEEADDHVRQSFEYSLDLLRKAGARIDMIAVPEFERLAHINRKGGLVASEAWAWHQEHMARGEAQYDPRVSTRILRGRDMTAADYIELLAARTSWIQAVNARLRWYDALLMPTSPIVAPEIARLEASSDDYFMTNALILRNPTFINFLDGCGLSLPCHPAGTAAVGLMVAGPAMQDAHILETGLCVERVLQEGR